ncbi:pyroglutamyl-peptidase [Salsuginibacillus halophilus]|uniref:Pyroglutamyl-peptidase I n=1 Tax=Salsuginibacillus halophilus TaxID=517424 RepID=A0A2P8HXM2_9BACI|nr:peptidase C15 [Salsuginibacillus halophilus]PSL50979.1 pyroglutamyl-peptidase [Salsuginibacillus halophilus]
MKVLCTGFEPFGQMKSNPTERLMTKIAEEYQGSQVIQLKTKVLPVVFDTCVDALWEEVTLFRPDVIVSTGLAYGRSGVNIERIGINVKDSGSSDGAPKDNQGRAYTGEVIAAGGPDALFSTLPIDQMKEDLQEKEIPSVISNTAGTYICNQTLYETLYRLQEQKWETVCGFLHFPALPEMTLQKPSTPSMSLDLQQKALSTVIQTLAAEHLQ